MALAKETGSLRDLFILKPAGGPKLTTLSTPSDLQGFLFTDYRLKSDDRSIEIIDALGFRAALRSAIHRKAKEHNMVGSRLEAYVGPEDGDEDDPGNTKPPKSGPNAGDEARTTGKKPAKRKVEGRT